MARLAGGGKGSAPGGLMVSCLGRGEALYGAAGVESELLREAYGRELALAGLFAGGEIGPVGARTFVHTYTTTIGLLRERRDGAATNLEEENPSAGS